eukprot:gene50169-67182_t
MSAISSMNTEITMPKLAGNSMSASTVTAPPPTAAPTTVSTTPASTTTSTTVPATTTTSIPKAAVLVLRADGLGDALFGTDPDQVIAYVAANLGKPTADSGWADPFSAFGVCPGTEVRGVTWGDLTLLFSDDSPVVSGRRHFFSYLLGPPFGSTVQPAGMTTAERIGVGNTVGELRFTYPDVELFDDELAGPSFLLASGINGGMTGLADDELSLYDLYRTGLWVQVGVNAAAGLWALAAHRWPSVRSKALWVFTVVAQLVVTANVVMASVLLARYDWEFPELHMLYEFSGLVAI